MELSAEFAKEFIEWATEVDRLVKQMWLERPETHGAPKVIVPESKPMVEILNGLFPELQDVVSSREKERIARGKAEVLAANQARIAEAEEAEKRQEAWAAKVQGDEDA